MKTILAAEIEASAMTLNEIAETHNLQPSTLERFAAGHSAPSARLAQAIAGLFAQPVSHFAFASPGSPFASRLRELMEEHQLSDADIAAALDLTNVSSLRQGLRPPSRELYLDFVKFFEVSPSDLGLDPSTLSRSRGHGARTKKVVPTLTQWRRGNAQQAEPRLPPSIEQREPKPEPRRAKRAGKRTAALPRVPVDRSVLAAEMYDAGINEHDLAERTGYDANTIRRAAFDTTVVGRAMAVRLAEAMGKPVEHFRFRLRDKKEDAPPPPSPLASDTSADVVLDGEQAIVTLRVPLARLDDTLAAAGITTTILRRRA
jgi:transcriptional regulator with XRE-family HTH domain